MGEKAAKTLAAHFGTMDALLSATEEELTAIADVGPITAGYIRQWVESPQSRDLLERLRAADAESIRDLGIKLKRVESTAKTATATVVELRAKLRDTAVVRETSAGAVIIDSMRTFRWRDPWVTVEGLIERDSVACRVESIDTLRQVVHRVPRRFLFIRWGTKAIRQEVMSSNPHTRIVYTDYIELKKRNR